VNNRNRHAGEVKPGESPDFSGVPASQVLTSRLGKSEQNSRGNGFLRIPPPIQNRLEPLDRLEAGVRGDSVILDHLISDRATTTAKLVVIRTK
jgi:hypothetical protein